MALKRSLSTFLCLLLCMFPLFGWAAQQGSVHVTSVKVDGNLRVDRETIESYLGLEPGKTYTQSDLDRSIKDLYATGLFSHIDIANHDGKLVVDVKENPIINVIAFEGNKRVKKEDLEMETYLKSRMVYNKMRLQHDVSRILSIYQKHGRYGAKVEPKLITLPDNRVNLVFEIDEGAMTPIKQIHFIGNDAIDEGSLKEAMITKEDRWYRFLSTASNYDPDRLEFDKEVIRRFYHARGYPDFRVLSSVAELSPGRDALYVTITVEEGGKYRFGNVDVESDIKSVDSTSLKALLKTHKGDLYNGNHVEKSIDALIRHLGDKGFAFVNVHPDLKLRPEDALVDLTYRIEESQKIYIREINIVGNSRTHDKVIRREFRLSEGDPYNTTKLMRTEQRNRDLNYFEDFHIDTIRTEDPDKVDLEVKVEEKSTGSLQFAAGASSNSGLIAKIGYKEINFLGKGQRMSFDVERAKRDLNFDFSFTEPYFMDRPVATGFDIFSRRSNRDKYSSFKSRTLGGDLRMSYELTEYLTHSVSYLLKKQDIHDVVDNASLIIKEQQGKRITSQIGHSFRYDRRNSAIAPTEGYMLEFMQQVSGLGGDVKVFRNLISGSYYYPVTDVITAQFGATAASVKGIMGKKVNIAERFFIGGDDLRGFRVAGIGPRDKITDDALGGNFYYTARAQLNFPIGLPKEMGVKGFAFGDAGSLMDVDVASEALKANVLAKDTLRASVGFGILWYAPVGILQFNIAEPVKKEPFDKTRTYNFSIGTAF